MAVNFGGDLRSLTRYIVTAAAPMMKATGWPVSSDALMRWGPKISTHT